MAGADTDTLAVQDRSEVVRVHILECEAHHTAPLADGGTVDAQPFDIAEPRLGESHPAPLSVGYPGRYDPLCAGDDSSETICIRGSRSWRLELVPQHVPGRSVVGYGLTQVSATLARRYFFVSFPSAV